MITYFHLRTAQFLLKVRHRVERKFDPPPQTSTLSGYGRDGIGVVMMARRRPQRHHLTCGGSAAAQQRWGGLISGGAGGLAGGRAWRACEECQGDGQGRGIGRGVGLQGLSAGAGGWWARIDPFLEQGLPWAPVVRLRSWARGCRWPEWATYDWLACQGGGGPSSFSDIC